jgi:hypothetical protein
MYQPPINTLQAAYGFFLQYQYADQRVQRAFDTVLLELLTTKPIIKGRTTVVTLKPEYEGVEGLHIVEEDVDEQQLAAAMLLQYQILPETVQREFLEIHTAYTDRSDGNDLYFFNDFKVGHLSFEIHDAGAYFADSTTFENCFYFIGHPCESYEPRESVLYEIAQVFKDGESGKENWTYYPNCQSIREAAYFALLLENNIKP